MAIIYTYPVKATPNANDLILISDSEDSNKTKQVKISTLPGGSGSGVSSVTSANVAITVADASTTPVLTSVAYSGGANIGHVPTGSGSSATVYLDGTGNWSTPAGSGGPGTGTANSIPKWATSSTLGDSNIVDDNSTVTFSKNIVIKGDGSAEPGKLKLRCYDNTTSHHVELLGPVHAGAASYSLQFPNAQSTGTQILQADSSGLLSWIATPTSGGAPGGSSTQFQYNNGTTFAGTDSLRFDADKIHMGRSTSPITRGQLVMYGDGTNASDIQLYNGGNNRFLKIAQQAGATQDLTLTFPGVAPGGNNKILESDSTGQLSWIATPTGSGGISFSGATVSGIATFASTSSATVNSEVKLLANGQMTFDGSGSNVGIKYDVGSTTLRVGDVVGNSESVALYSDGAAKITISDSDVTVVDTTQFNSGLKFGVSGSILSTYTEATWTSGPTLTFSVGGAATLSASAGSYRVIGDMVFAQFQFTFGSGGYGTANLSLPVSGVAGTGSINFVKMNSNVGNSTVSTPVTGDILTNAASIRLKSFNYDQDSSSHVSGQLFELVDSAGQPIFGNGDVVSGTITYRKS